MSENNTKGCMKIYVGTDEDSADDYLYLDLSIPGRDVPIWNSGYSLNDCSSQDLLLAVERAFNEARLFTKALGLKTVIETEEILILAEEMEESTLNNVKHLIKEMQ